MPHFHRNLLSSAILFALGSNPAHAVYIDVDNTQCTLWEAIEAANTDTAVGVCPAGDGYDHLRITESLLLGDYIPAITSDVKIFADPASNIVIEGGSIVKKQLGLLKATTPLQRLFFVGGREAGVDLAPEVQFQNLTLRHGDVTGGRGGTPGGGGGAGMGGIVFVYDGNVSFSNITFDGGHVRGGTGGGTYTSADQSGAGGGGMAGQGAYGTNSGSGLTASTPIMLGSGGGSGGASNQIGGDGGGGGGSITGFGVHGEQGGNGGDASFDILGGGGGGAGGDSISAAPGNGGSGAFGGGGGGGGAASAVSDYYGGNGGHGGFGGGGGAGGRANYRGSIGGYGGFGGGAGSADFEENGDPHDKPGLPGQHGGSTFTGIGGGGGAGLGGAVFVRKGNVSFRYNSFIYNGVSGGPAGSVGASAGEAKGAAIYVMTALTSDNGNSQGVPAADEMPVPSGCANTFTGNNGTNPLNNSDTDNADIYGVSYSMLIAGCEMLFKDSLED